MRWTIRTGNATDATRQQEAETLRRSEVLRGDTLHALKRAILAQRLTPGTATEKLRDGERLLRCSAGRACRGTGAIPKLRATAA